MPRARHQRLCFTYPKKGTHSSSQLVDDKWSGADLCSRLLDDRNHPSQRVENFHTNSQRIVVVLPSHFSLRPETSRLRVPVSQDILLRRSQLGLWICCNLNSLMSSIGLPLGAPLLVDRLDRVGCISFLDILHLCLSGREPFLESLCFCSRGRRHGRCGRNRWPWLGRQRTDSAIEWIGALRYRTDDVATYKRHKERVGPNVR